MKPFVVLAVLAQPAFKNIIYGKKRPMKGRFFLSR